MRNKKRIASAVLALLSVVCLALVLVPSPVDEEETLSLYFPVATEALESGGDAIRAVRVDWRERRQESNQQQAEAVMELLLGGHGQSVAPAGTRVLSTKVEGSTVTVDFSGAYRQLSGIALSRADYCVAMSLAQIPGIYTVRITVEGRELAYRHKNSFHADEVLLTSPEDVVRNMSVQLCFPLETLLSSEERILTIYEGESPVEAVMEALMEGPRKEGLQPLLPEDFSYLTVRLEGKVCYLNLPKTEAQRPNVNYRQMVSGIVRSLCSVRGVTQVQFLIEGERRDILGNVDISQPLALYNLP